MTEIRNLKLSQVERGMEEALRDFRANGSGDLPEIAAAEHIDKIGNMSALAIAEASEATAKDIEEAGQVAVDAAAEIMEEAQRIASELRANGKKMSNHLQEFAKLATRISTAMRDTRAEVLNSSETPVKSGDEVLN